MPLPKYASSLVITRSLAKLDIYFCGICIYPDYAVSSSNFVKSQWIQSHTNIPTVFKSSKFFIESALTKCFNSTWMSKLHNQSIYHWFTLIMLLKLDTYSVKTSLKCPKKARVLEQIIEARTKKDRIFTLFCWHMQHFSPPSMLRIYATNGIRHK